MSIIQSITTAISDIKACIDRFYLPFMLGWQDIRQRYRRSSLGPFWITISMGVMIGVMGVVFGQVLNAPMGDYLPFLATGIILWTCFSSCLMEGSSSFIDAAGMIRQLNLPLSLYPVRVIWRNLVIFAHNIVILPVVFLVLGKPLTWNIVWLLPGALLFVLNIFWISLFLGTLCTRYRDMPPIVNSLLQVFFYITPVIWMPNALNPRSANLLVEPNPIYHLVQLIRAPILGDAPTRLNWQVSFAFFVFGILFALWFFGKYKKRIAYWL